MNNLPEIKDIHIPDTVSMFPLAYGWWIILAALIILFLLVKFIIFIIKTSKKYYALKELEDLDTIDNIDAVIGVSNLLRRICSIKHKNAATLYGKDWVNFLTNDGLSLSKEASNLLIYAPFMDKKSKNFKPQHVDEIKAFCKKWIGDNL